LAIAGITGVYYLVFGVMGFGLSSGLQALMSRRAGENRSEEIGLLFFQAGAYCHCICNSRNFDHLLYSSCYSKIFLA
jgi:hypothetical protein